jgi:threonine dehydrogenase-like Zn-dependent dehydrogenase
VEPAYVAFHCIRESNVRYGDRVAVVGLGALGLLAVRMAVDAGAALVLAVDPLPRRRDVAAALGAHLTLDPTADDPALALERLSGDLGVDVAIELSGSYAALHSAIRMTRVGGTVCSAGFYQGDARGLWLGHEWHHNRLTMIVPHGCGWGHPPRDYPRWTDQRAYDCLASLIQARRLTAPGLVNHVVKFEDAVSLLGDMRARPNDVIKYAVRLPASG